MEIENCPYCGHKASLIQEMRARGGPFGGVERSGFIIRCNKCRAQMRGTNKSDLIKAWNRRSYPEDLCSKTEVCKEIGRFIGYLDEDMIERLQIVVKRMPAIDGGAK